MSAFASLIDRARPHWKTAALVALSSAIIFVIATRLTFLYWDSFQFLNGARHIAGRGHWLNPYYHPILSCVYSLLLLFQSSPSILVELRAACFFAAFITTGALLMGTLWICWCVPKGLPRTIALAFFLFNPVVIHYGAMPLSDFIAVVFSVGILWYANRLAQTGNVKDILMTTFLIGLSVPFKYHTWVLVPVVLIHVFRERGVQGMRSLWVPLMIIPAGSLILALSIQFSIWAIYTNDVLATAKGFSKSLSSATIYNLTPSYILDYFNWCMKKMGPFALILIAIGSVRGFFSAHPMVRLSALWFWASTLFFAQFIFAERYLIHALPATAVLLFVGFDSLLELTNKRLWMKIVMASLLLGWMMWMGVLEFQLMNRPAYVHKRNIEFGTLIKEELPAENDLFLEGGSASWIEFVADRIPKETWRFKTTGRNGIAWPLEALPYFKDGDMWIITRQSFPKETILMRISVESFKKVDTRESKKFVSDDRTIPLKRVAGKYLLELDQRPLSCWLVETTDGIQFIAKTVSPMETSMFRSAIGLRRIQLTPLARIPAHG